MKKEELIQLRELFFTYIASYAGAHSVTGVALEKILLNMDGAIKNKKSANRITTIGELEDSGEIPKVY